MTSISGTTGNPTGVPNANTTNNNKHSNQNGSDYKISFRDASIYLIAREHERIVRTSSHARTAKVIRWIGESVIIEPIMMVDINTKEPANTTPMATFCHNGIAIVRASPSSNASRSASNSSW